MDSDSTFKKSAQQNLGAKVNSVAVIFGAWLFEDNLWFNVSTAYVEKARI